MSSLAWTDVLFAWLAMALHLSWCARVDRALAATWLWSSVRAAVQLAALGYVLLFLFGRNDWRWSALAVTVMILVSAWTVAARAGVPRRALFVDSLVALVAGLAVVVVPLALWLRTRDFFHASVFLPFVGILLGNSLSGLTLGIAQWHTELRQRREEIEYWLSVGATPREAARALRSSALRTAMTVVLNAMAVSGIVSIPGQMAGQLLAGGSPDVAVKYQLVILFLLAATVAVSSWTALRLLLRRAFDRFGAAEAR